MKNLRDLLCGLSDDEYRKLVQDVQFGAASTVVVMESVLMEATTQIKVILPYPSRSTYPNSRSHWSTKQKATRQQRGDAALAAKVAMQDLPAAPNWEFASILAVFYKPVCSFKHSDPDNLIAWLKASIDGLQDAKLIQNDSRLIWLPPWQRICDNGQGDRRPRVELILSQVEAADMRRQFGDEWGK